jgi:hypothetical protein
LRIAHFDLQLAAFALSLRRIRKNRKNKEEWQRRTAKAKLCSVLERFM